MDARTVLRHFVATLDYRCTKAIAKASDSFSQFEAGNGARKPIEILSHISTLLSWTQTVIGGNANSSASTGNWHEEALRFQNEIQQLDQLLADKDIPDDTIFKLLQGPLADAMTHVGQLALLRRLADQPIETENYFTANIGVKG